MEERRALVEILDRDGEVRARQAVTAWPQRVGRAFDCDLVLDDPHVAALHAELDLGPEGRITVRALPSLNGVQIDGRTLRAGEAAAPLGNGEVLRLGRTALRLRLAGEALAPERPLARPAAVRLATDVALAVGTLAVMAMVGWFELEPEGKRSTLLAGLLGLGVGLVAWAGLWGLGSKLFQGHFVFRPHLRRALVSLLAVELADLGLNGLSFSLSWGLASRLAGWGQGACLFALVWSHLSIVLPSRRRIMGAVALSLFAVSLALSMGFSWQRNDRLFGELYSTTLGPPALRLTRPVAPERLLDEVRGLKDTLDGHAREEGTDAGFDF